MLTASDPVSNWSRRGGPSLSPTMIPSWSGSLPSPQATTCFRGIRTGTSTADVPVGARPRTRSAATRKTLDPIAMFFPNPAPGPVGSFANHRGGRTLFRQPPSFHPGSSLAGHSSLQLLDAEVGHTDPAVLPRVHAFLARMEQGAPRIAHPSQL